MGSRLPYRGLQNCASLLAGGTGTVIGIGTPVGRDVEVDRAVAVRLGSGGGGVVAVGIVLSVAVGEETGVGVAVGREVEAGTGAWPSVGDGVGDSFAVATAVGGSPGVGGGSSTVGRTDVAVGSATGVVVSVRAGSPGRGTAVAGVPVHRRLQLQMPGRQTHIQENNGCHTLLPESHRLRAGGLRDPGRAPRGTYPWAGLVAAIRTPRYDGCAHAGRATMTNSADTTIRALDKLEILRSLSSAAFSDAAPFRHPWAETTGPSDSSALNLRQYQAAPVNLHGLGSAPPPFGPSAPVSS